MKLTKIKIILVLMLLVIGINAFANLVDMHTAITVANNFMAKCSQLSKTVQDVVVEKYDGQNALYVVNFQDGGWVMVSTEYNTVPVFAYSTEGRYEIDGEKPPGFVFFVDEYKEMINIIRKKEKNRNSEIIEMWNELLNDENQKVDLSLNSTESSSRLPGFSVDPLLDVPGRGQVEWGQDRNNSPSPNFCNPSYNMFISQSNGSNCKCGRKPVGCGAVAIGQVMWYWQWPPTFYWEIMPAKLYDGQMDEGTEIAGFLKYCATAVGMIYSCNGSFAFPASMEFGLRNSFDFKGISVEDYLDYEFWDEWVGMTKAELDCGRPVIYKGEKSFFSTEKHYFVVDGYGTPDPFFFHINFGWPNNNYNFSWHYLWDIYSPSEEGNYDYRTWLVAFIGLSPTYTNVINVTDVDYTEVIGRGYVEAKQNISLPASGKDLTIEDGGFLKLVAGNSITLNAGFQANVGSKFEASTNPMHTIDMEISVPNWPTQACSNNNFRMPVNNANSSDIVVKNSSGKIVFRFANMTVFDDAILWTNSGGPPPGVYTCTVRLRNNYGRLLEHTWNVTVTNCP